MQLNVNEGDIVVTFGAGDVNKIGYDLLKIFRKVKLKEKNGQKKE